MRIRSRWRGRLRIGGSYEIEENILKSYLAILITIVSLCLILNACAENPLYPESNWGGENRTPSTRYLSALTQEEVVAKTGLFKCSRIQMIDVVKKALENKGLPIDSVEVDKGKITTALASFGSKTMQISASIVAVGEEYSRVDWVAFRQNTGQLYLGDARKDFNEAWNFQIFKILKSREEPPRP